MKVNTVPNFDRLEGMMSSGDFVISFCQKVIYLLEEFERKYVAAIEDSKEDHLNEITHKIQSTMKMLGLEDFYFFTKSYEKMDFRDKLAKVELVEKTLSYVSTIKQSMMEKQESVG